MLQKVVENIKTRRGIALTLVGVIAVICIAVGVMVAPWERTVMEFDGLGTPYATIRIVNSKAVAPISPDFAQNTDNTVTLKITNANASKSGSDVDLKVLVQANNKQEFYAFDANGKAQSYPLQFGKGNYTIMVCQHIADGKYAGVFAKQVKVDTDYSYLGSAYNVDWKNAPQSQKAAKAAIAKAATDKEKVTAIYNYLVKSIQYDFSKVGNMSSWYIPNLDSTLKTKKGVCYDSAALFTGMLRSVGIPAKLCFGTAKDVEQYHAWSEVQIDKKWITIDVSVDAQRYGFKQKTTMAKSASDYKVDKYY